MLRFTFRAKLLLFFIFVTFFILKMNWPDRLWSSIHKKIPKTWAPEERQPSATLSDWIDPDAKDSSHWNREEAFKRDIPRYVLEHAPLIHLHPDEPYWIADPAEFLKHVKPQRAGQVLPHSIGLSNLSRLDNLKENQDVFLASDDDVDDVPPWMTALWNIPTEYPLPTTSTPMTDASYPPAIDMAKKDGWYSASPISFLEVPPLDFKPTDWSKLLQNPSNSSTPGFSAAPGVLITVAKENSVLDAFWFIFNSFNLGNKVFGRRYGNHVGDWEHVMIRFQNGQPKALFTSRHSFGNSVYAWDVLQKNGQRPIVYSARGSHAMYVSAGVQPYILPLHILSDNTAAGPLWDPALIPGLKAYTYDAKKDEIRASSLSPVAATSWLDFSGHWGDPPTSFFNFSQYRLGSRHRYSNGPTGPKFKNLGRKFPCESTSGTCQIKTALRP